MAPNPASLQRLAEVGVGDLPPAKLGETAEDSWAWGEATGDARFCILWRTLKMVDQWFGDEDGAVATAFCDRLDAVVTREMPGILDAEASDEGTALAATMRDMLVAEYNFAGDPRRPHY